MTKRLLNPFRHLCASDIRGVAQLATKATTSVTRIAEGVHQSVWDTIGVPGGKEPGQTRGITSLSYKSVYAVTRLLGAGVDSALTRLEPLFKSYGGSGTPEREIILAALNGFIGDRLNRNSNPLATSMSLHYQNQELSCQTPLSVSDAKNKVLLLVHGLCMNDQQWQTRNQEETFDHGAIVASKLNYSPVYLRYNTGLHISLNGRELSLRLERLFKHWPMPVQELAVIGYSMGGLLIRSALHYARQESLTWPNCLKNIIFLGSPHHGVPMARASNWLDHILGTTPYTRPFVRLGQLRSEGMMDLRHGNLVDEDWQNHELYEKTPDSRQVILLPAGVACHTIAATTGDGNSVLAERLIGDGLVPLNSALGVHDDIEKSLMFEPASQKIIYGVNHLQLLSNPCAAAQMIEWLSPS